MKPFFSILALLALSGCAMMRGGPPLETVERVDLERYMGQWYVIANIPYFGERGNVAGRAIYRLREDGRIDDIYRYRDGSFDAPEEEMKGVAWVVDEETNAQWKVQFYWPIRFGYYIIGLDEAYEWAVVGHPSREYAWIMAREPELSNARYQALLDLLEASGFEASQLQKVAQRPAQVGQPGFQ
ncbi:lipocalin family protein [Wenzhouxiangella sp. XN201]|uniref:lipocalin family protein n=1 Tax=Wenzhouxiangella sp. XN201 TaxID=2710755 RepID=UPI001969B17D|nr:lipocalin family protein [Wenzhouxiangella sp. XN201]